MCIFAAVTYILKTMKKLFLCMIIVMTVLQVQAAPPLRGLLSMRLNDGTIVAPTDLHQSVLVDGHICASEAVIGSGTYLPHKGSPRVLTILAAFQDLGFTVNEPVRAFDQYLNGDKQEDLGNSNDMNMSSVRQYYEVSSQGQFSPQFDIVGPVILPKKMSYYGGSNSSGSDDKFGDFCRDALAQVKDMVSDWSVYDNDNDGNVELVCVIFAGYGQNQGGGDSTIWAKAASQNLTVNNHYRITRFNCSPELFNPSKGVDGKGNPYDYSQYINGTGVFIHEMSHCMGLPDLYATQSRAHVNNQGMETWSIMDYGLYNYNGFAPAPYTAWEQEVMGWTEIENVRSKLVDGKWTVEDVMPLIEGGKAYKLQNPDNDRNYIVMENVQQRGLNKHAYGHGLLVYQVDYPYSSVNMSDHPNNNPGHPSVAVVPASGELINAYLRGSGKPYTMNEWKASIAASTFPGTRGVMSLTNEMELPNYCFYVNQTVQPINFMLSGITEDAETGAVSFLVAEDDPTGIATLNMEHGTFNDDAIYDLQGRRMGATLKLGIYIINGRKVVIK